MNIPEPYLIAVGIACIVGSVFAFIRMRRKANDGKSKGGGKELPKDRDEINPPGRL